MLCKLCSPLPNQFLNNTAFKVGPSQVCLGDIFESLNRSCVTICFLYLPKRSLGRLQFTAVGFLRGTSCCHGPLASEERQGNPDCRSETRKETEREGMNATARVCARLCGRETGASCAFEMRVCVCARSAA